MNEKAELRRLLREASNYLKDYARDRRSTLIGGYPSESVLRLELTIEQIDEALR